MGKRDFERWSTLNFIIALLCIVLVIIGVVVLIITLINKKDIWVGSLLIGVAIFVFIFNITNELRIRKRLLRY